jgi:multiple sugar transport system permease protein
MWGLGLVFFILIVLIPFYVMVLTSLKNQQSLLRNPLDLSIDFSVAPEKLFNSYIELFVKYDFLTLLLNSAFVSVVTVFITLLFSIPGAYAVAKLRFPHVNGSQALSC